MTVHGWAGTPRMRVAVEIPAGARAGVVICPPFGQEGVIAYRALRLLAAELADRGIASVRYDPHGHGDSAPLTSPAHTADHAATAGPSDAVRSALEAADVLRSMGCVEPGFIGLASGALIASEAARVTAGTDRDDTDNCSVAEGPLVVWDAPVSGKGWLRRQRALASMSISTERTTAEFETIVGVDLTPSEIRALAAMRIASTPTRPTLAAVRPGDAVPAGLADDADRIEVNGMAELLDGESVRARIPRQAVEDIATWTSMHLVRSEEPLSTPSLGTELVLDDGITEVIRSYGPEQLFGIETIPVGAGPDTPVVLLHNGAAEHRVGASDYQVVLARALAADGVRVVRLDRRGTGESSSVHADERSFLFTEEWISDQDAVIDDLEVTGDRLALVGMCAGAWLAARAVDRAPRLVVQISPNDYRRRPTTPGAYQDALVAVHEASPGRVRLRNWWNRLVPEKVRRVVDRRGRRGGVAEQLEPLARAGTAVALVVGPEDARLFDELGGERTAARLPGVDVVRVMDGDHSLFSPHMRDVVLAEVRQRVAESFPHTSPTTREPVSA